MVQNVGQQDWKLTFRTMGSRPTKTDALLRLAQKGPFRTRDLVAAGIPRSYLRRFQDRRLVEQLDRGLYRLVGAPATELQSLAEVSKRVPHGIICLLSALQVHGLTTEVPHAVWILIDRNARVPRLSYPKLEIVRASGPARAHGVDLIAVEGVQVRVTSPAKTVADCFRFRRHVGLDVAIAALRDYLSRSRKRAASGVRTSIDALVAAARADRVHSVIRPYLEALA